MDISHEWYTVENTGWSGGISWFSSSSRYASADAAIAVIELRKSEINDPEMLWRYAHVRRKVKGNTETITSTWTTV